MMSGDTAGVAIIGAGPAGLMAAERLSALGLKVTIFERMPSPARKFLLAGRGGLNLTHSEQPETFIARYRQAKERLGPAIAAFGAQDLQKWCETLGEPTFTGSSGRVFPRSFKASPLLRALLRRLEAQNVTFRMRHRWRGWTDDGLLLFENGEGQTVTANADATLLALGGASWPRLGSDGSWTATLTNAGIGVSPLRPANSGFTIEWSPAFRSRFRGEPLKRIALSLNGERVRGEAMITADGIEGGAVYALSAPIRDALEAGSAINVTIDLRPDLSQTTLATRLSSGRGSASVANHLRKRAGLSAVAIGIMRESASSGLPQDSAQLAHLIKNAVLTITSARPIDRAISTAGGIRFEEIDERFMLRCMPGIFVAGEMIDWEAPTGGYLLQACFSTAVAAADGIMTMLADKARR